MTRRPADSPIKIALAKVKNAWEAFINKPAVAKTLALAVIAWSVVCGTLLKLWQAFISLPVIAKTAEWIMRQLKRLPFYDKAAAIAAAVLSRRKLYLRFLAINLALLIVASPLIVIYGPFSNIKRTVVGAIVTSRHPQYITWLLSEAQIRKIVGDEVDVAKLRQQVLQFTKREDDTLRLVNISSSRFQGYLLEVPDPTRVKAATARDIQEKGDTVSTIALTNNAIAAINAGGFHDPQGTGTGRLPYGVIISEGKFLVGGDITDPVQVIGLTKSGVLMAGTYTANEMKAMNLAEGVTFGPPLIINGKKLITEGDGGWGIAPRTAIGQRQDGTILLLVIDGRQPGYSLGATLLDVQNILYEQGAYNAANLDGGSSTTLFYNGKVVNRPADMLGERMIPTAFIVK